MTIPKPLFAIFLILLIGVAIIFFSKGCTPEPAVDTHITDSLKWVIKTDSAQYHDQSKKKDDSIRYYKNALDTVNKVLAKTREQFTIQGQQILATNKLLHAALIVHDTPAVYKNAEQLAYQLDSITGVAWNMGRELDRQIVLNEQLHFTDSIALADCRNAYKKLQGNTSLMQQTYDLELQAAQNDVKKAKRKNKLWGGIGVLLGGAIRSFIK
jgi:hypothetical protein